MSGRPSPRGRVMLAFGAFGVWWGAWGALLPAVQRSAGVDDGRLGRALLFVGVGALASMRITGWLVDRSGRVVVTVAVAGLGVAGMGPALAHGVLPLAVTMAMLGITSGAYDVAANAEASRLEATSKRPVLGLAHAGFSFGVIAGSLTAGALGAAGVSLTGALGVSCVVLGAVAACLAPGRSGRGAGAPPGLAAEGAVRGDTGPGWRWWHPPARLAVLGCLMALAFLIESAWQTWSAVHLERDLHASEALASVGPAVFGASAGVGRLLVHWRSAPGREGRMIAAGAGLAAVAGAAAALVPVTPLVVVGIALVGLGTAAAAPKLVSLAGRAVSVREAGAAVGTVTTLGYLGFVLAPAAVGALAGATSLPTALAAVGGPALALAAGAGVLARWPVSGGAGGPRPAQGGDAGGFP